MSRHKVSFAEYSTVGTPARKPVKMILRTHRLGRTPRKKLTCVDLPIGRKSVSKTDNLGSSPSPRAVTYPCGGIGRRAGFKLQSSGEGPNPSGDTKTVIVR